MIRSHSLQAGDSPSRLTCVVRLMVLATWAGALAYISLAPTVKAPPGPFGWDKFNHFAAYAVLALLQIRVLSLWWTPSLYLLFISWAMCSSYGLLLETLQAVMGVGRQCEATDLFANALGALVACVLFRHAGRRFFHNGQ